MIEQNVIDEARRLLATGQLGYREIAARLGVSHSTVGVIACGKRRDQCPRPARPSIDPNAPKSKSRCPTCGCMAVQPCHACRVRSSISRLPRPLREEGGYLVFDLRPEHRARLEEVRAARSLHNTSDQAPADRAA